MSVTNRGRKLADGLGRYIGWTSKISEQCSKLARDAKAYSTIQERWCNEEMSEAVTERLEKREAALETSIRDQVERLPQPDEGPWRVVFQGDPRGCTVRLVAPDGREIGCDD